MTGEGPIGFAVCAGVVVGNAASTFNDLNNLAEKANKIQNEIDAIESTCPGPGDSRRRSERLDELRQQLLQNTAQSVRAGLIGGLVELGAFIACPFLIAQPF